ncbi:MAG: BatA domain-containing protein [Bacteroidota bacterium]
MSFVHPGYLWFFSLLVIPVLIHLFYFRRHKRFYFPSLKYLKKQEQEKKSIKNLKRWLILACRLLLISSLILAFAQPHWKTDKLTKDGVTITAIYLDNSYSMSAKGVEGVLLSESKEVAKRIILEGNSKSRYMLCSNALSGTERKIHTQSTAIRYIDELQFNRTPRNLTSILTFQEEFLQRYHREFIPISSVNRVIISDFQKSTSIMERYEARKYPYPISTHVLQTVPQKLENHTIDSVWTESPVHKPGTPLQLFFRVMNGSNYPAENINVTLQFDGKKRMTNLSLTPQQSSVAYFNITPQGTGYLEGKLSLSDATVTWDDDFYFTNRSAKSAKVLMVHGKEARKSPERVFRTEPYYETTSLEEFAFGSRDLNNIDLLILNELNTIPSGTAETVISFVAKGGSVFIIPGMSVNIKEYNTLLKSLDLLPFTGTTADGNQVAEIKYRSLFFRGMFEKEKKDLNLPLIKSLYIQRNSRISNAETLIELRNKLPLLVHQRKNGNVFLLTACPQASNGGLSKHALYPSMLLRAAELSIRSLPMYYFLGQAAQLSLENTGNTDEPLKLQKEQQQFIPKQLQSGNLVYMQLNTPELLERMEGGIYEIKGTDRIAKLGMNLDRKESMLDYLDEKGIKNMFTSKGLNDVHFSKIDDGASAYQLELDKPSSFWEFFIILALVFALAEMAIIKFILP